MEKFIVQSDSISIALKFNPLVGRMVIGGNIHARRLMEELLSEYFGVKVRRFKKTQANKIRYEVRMGRTRFESGLDQLADHGIVFTAVKSLGRIMR